jgi:hypothetical protein
VAAGLQLLSTAHLIQPRAIGQSSECQLRPRALDCPHCSLIPVSSSTCGLVFHSLTRLVHLPLQSPPAAPLRAALRGSGLGCCCGRPPRWMSGLWRVSARGGTGSGCSCLTLSILGGLQVRCCLRRPGP